MKSNSNSEPSSSPDHDAVAEPRTFIDGAYEDWDLSFDTIVESINDGILVVRFDGHIIYVNPRMADILGYRPEEVLGDHVFDFMDQQWAEKTRQHLTRRRQGLEDQYDHQVRHRDGTPLWLRISAKPIRDAHGHPQASLVAAQEITQRKQMEQQLLEARQSAEEADRAKGDFLARMSHEIRTPMNGVVGMLELLESTDISDEQNHYLQTAKEAADGLLTLIDDILDLSKIEARRLQLQSLEFSLRDAISETLQTLARQAADKQLDLVYFVDDDIPSHLRGDPDRLRQILINLVKNSIKFTDEGQISVTVDVRPPPQDQQWTIHFAISDTGRGIPEEQQERIFDAFHQAQSDPEGHQEGTGLGLTIAAQLVELMDGRIWLESELGQGSTFHFTADFEAVESTDDRPRDGRTHPLADIPALVVEPNSVNRRLIRTLLSHWDMKPTVVDDPHTEMEVIEVHPDPFDLVIVGWNSHLGKDDGLQWIDTIRTQLGPDVAVIALTPTDSVLPSETVQTHGIDRQLRQPIRPSALLDAISKALDIETQVDPPPSRPSLPDPTERPLEILLAEDNPVNQRVTVALLEKRGHDVEVVENGHHAVERVADNPTFDLILMDIQMPELDGYEATAEIRSQERDSERHIPIVALTAHAMSGDRERILEAGMDAYLSKPVSADELYETIESINIPE